MVRCDVTKHSIDCTTTLEKLPGLDKDTLNFTYSKTWNSMIYITDKYVYFQANGKKVTIEHGINDSSSIKMTFNQDEDYLKLETGYTVHLFRFPIEEE